MGGWVSGLTGRSAGWWAGRWLGRWVDRWVGGRKVSPVFITHLLDVDALRLDLSFELSSDDHQLRPLPPCQKSKTQEEGKDDDRGAMGERKHEKKTRVRARSAFGPETSRTVKGSSTAGTIVYPKYR